MSLDKVGATPTLPTNFKLENKMEKISITEPYLRELIREEKNESTKAWMMSCLDLGTDKHEAEKENRRLTKENQRMYGLLKFHNIY